MRKTLACLLLLAQLIFPLALTAGVRNADRAAEARRAEVLRNGEPILLRLETLILTSAAEDCWSVDPTAVGQRYVRPGYYVPLRDPGESGFYLGEAVPAKPEDGRSISYESYRAELRDRPYRISAEAAEALIANTKNERDALLAWFESPEGEVFLAANYLNGEIAVTGLWANGTEYPVEKQIAEN